MKLSVITVNLNNASGLKNTMQSVYDQTYKDFEYIIVDGNSTDGSLDVIKEITKKHPEINTRWISETDTGVYEAMNKGIRMATGEYLLFLNSGDLLVNEKVLENIFSTEHIGDILYGRCNITKNGNVIYTTTPPKNITFGTLYYEGLAHQATFIKRILFGKEGLYREDFKYNSDIDFWYKSIILGKAKTEMLEFIVSDYNLEGISSRDNQSEAYNNEIKEILSQANFNKFVPDYEYWKNKTKSMEIYSWVDRKEILRLFVQLIYKIAIILKQKK